MELVVISGKGGTGKTTIAVALAELAGKAVKADCDVDAPNLYLLYKGEDIEKQGFVGGKKAVINPDICINCGICREYCRFDAIGENGVNTLKCEGCGTCTLVCPEGAISMVDEESASIIITRNNKGIISRAEMDIGSEGSGKLVTEVRKNAKRHGGNDGFIIIDGSPGVGCAVIASITGCSMALVVTEPTKSGLEDFVRVIEACRYFKVLPLVCINKCDINPQVTGEIEDFCCKNSLTIVGRIPYDDTVMKSINELKPITEYRDSSANLAIQHMWGKINNMIGGIINENSNSK